MFEKFFEQYESEEHEVIVIIGNCRGVPSKNAVTNIYKISIKIMAMLFCDSGELVPKSMWIDMPLAEEECNNDALSERLATHGVFLKCSMRMKSALCYLICLMSTMRMMLLTMRC